MRKRTYNKITRFHVEKIFQWCKNKYGRGRSRYPDLMFKMPDITNNPLALGEYDYEDNFIFINSLKHKSLIEVANTVIHEYMHYRFHDKKRYMNNDANMKYTENPMENHANAIAKRASKKCISELKKYHSQFNFKK